MSVLINLNPKIEPNVTKTETKGSIIIIFQYLNLILIRMRSDKIDASTELISLN